MENNGIYTALCAIMAELDAIPKTQGSDGLRYKYRGIDDVYNALHPLLGKHGVFVLPEALERQAEERKTAKGGFTQYVTMRMRYRFCHSDGSFVECVIIGEAMDSGDKATNKAMAIAHKYAILQTFCIPTEDMPDPDAEKEELAPSKKQIARDRQKAKVENPSPPSDPLFKKFWAVMRSRHGNDRDAMLADVSSFFHRPITTSNELTRGEIADWLSAATSDYVNNHEPV